MVEPNLGQQEYEFNWAPTLHQRLPCKEGHHPLESPDPGEETPVDGPHQRLLLILILQTEVGLLQGVEQHQCKVNHAADHHQLQILDAVKERTYICAQLQRSTEFPDQESYVVSVEEDARFALVAEMRAKVDPADDMPAPPELSLKAFLDVLRSILEIGDLGLDHLDVDVLSDEHGVLFHGHTHIAEFDISRDLHVGRNPIFGDAAPTGFLVVLLLFVLAGHVKFQIINS